MNPNDTQYDRPNRRFIPREGRKVFAQVGYDRDEAPFGKGIEVGLVVIKDLEPDDANESQPTDVELLATTKLWLNQKGEKFVARFARALRFAEGQPVADFDPELDEPGDDGTPGFAAVLGSNMGILVGNVVWREVKRDGKVKRRKDGSPVYEAEVQNYQPADLAALGLTVDGKLTDDVLKVIEAGETAYDEGLQKRNEWRANNPRPSSSGGSAGRPSAPARSSSASGGGSRPAALPPEEHKSQDDDSIPF